MSKLQDYQLILFDVDHTLTNDQRVISPRVQAALKLLAAQHIQLGVCTGRSFPILEVMVMPLFPEGSVHVTAGGAQVISKEGKIYWQKLLEHQAALEIIEQAEKFDAGFLLTQENRIYLNQKMASYFQASENLRRVKFLPYKDLKNYTTPLIPVFDAPLEFYNYLNERDDINYKQMKTYGRSNADITSKGVNKATGLMELSKILNIPLKKIIGIGDSENDDEFLQSVGHSVAMGNATDYLKSIAHRTIGHTNKDGLAIYLESIAQGADV